MARVIGIDLGSRFVKVVLIEQKGKPQLVKAALFSTPYSKDAPQKIDAEEFFNRIVSNIPLSVLRGAALAINIPSSSVTTIVVQLPKMSKKELEVACVAEARRRMVPTPGPTSVFQHIILGEVIVNKIPRYEILVIKTEKSCIDDIAHVFNAFAGINPSLISPTCYTATNLFPKNSDVHKFDTAFIDIGYDSIDVAISRKGNLYFYRNIKLGLRDIISHMSSSLGVAPDKTEEIIKDKGIPEIEIDLMKDKVKVAEEIMRQKYEVSIKGEAQQEINLLELRMLWDNEIERIVQEIRRTLIYYREQSKGTRVENIFFLGGGAPIKGLVSTLAKGVGGTCNVISSFGNIDIALEKDAELITETGALFAPAVSLALTITLAKKNENVIDFLPPAIKQQERRFQQQVGMIIFSVVIFSLSFLSWLKVFVDNKIIEQSIERLGFSLKRAERSLETMNQIKNQQKIVNERLNKISVILDERIDATSFLKEIAISVPDEVYLESVALGEDIEEDSTAGGTSDKQTPPVFPESAGQSGSDKGIIKLKIEAACFADYEKTVDLAQNFRDSLGKSGYFKNIEADPLSAGTITPVIGGIEGVTLTRPMLRQFTLRAEIAGEEEKAAKK